MKVPMIVLGRDATEPALAPHLQDLPVAGGAYEDPDAGAKLLGTLVPGTRVEADIDAGQTGCWGEVLLAGDVKGWCHLSGLVPAAGSHVPWLEAAVRQVGATAGNDAGRNRIHDYIRSVSAHLDLSVNWCACFINWCMKRADQPHIDEANARRWEAWGAVRGAGDGTVSADVRVGDIAIAERLDPADGLGHIACFIAYDTGRDRLLVLGGNQADNPLAPTLPKSVRYSWYPRKTTPPQPHGKLRSIHYRPEVDQLAP